MSYADYQIVPDYSSLTEPCPFEFIDDIEKRVFEELTNPPPGLNLEWWPKFNTLMGGLRMKELTVMSAPTGSGKTTLTAQLVCQALLAGSGSYICSAEIGNTLFTLAMYSAFESRDYVSQEKLPAEDTARLIRQYSGIMRSAPLIFSKNDDRIESSALIEEIRRAHSEFGIKLAILDNLQFFMPTVDAKDQLSVTDRAIRDFVRFVKTTPVHVVLIAHPKKTNDNRIGDETAVKGSSTIYQECSNFIALNRLSDLILEENPTLRVTDRELKFCKLRRKGMNQGKKVYFEFDGGRYCEKNVEWRC